MIFKVTGYWTSMVRSQAAYSSLDDAEHFESFENTTITR